MTKERLYHFYFDEGGLIGKAIVCVSNTLLTVEDNNEAHISNYYFGYLSLKSISRHLQLYNKCYPNNITYSKLSLVGNFLTLSC